MIKADINTDLDSKRLKRSLEVGRRQIDYSNFDINAAYERRRASYERSQRLKERRKRNYPRYVIRQRSRLQNEDCESHCDRQTRSISGQLKSIASSRQVCLVVRSLDFDFSGDLLI